MVLDFKQIKYADSYLSESAMFIGGVKGKMVPIVFSFYLFVLNDKIVLVDVGCDSMPGFIMENFVLPDYALSKYGVLPDDVTDIIITHADHDHIDGVHHFKNATVYIQKDEYARGEKYIPNTNNVVLFDDEIILYNEIRVVKIGGHQIGSSVVEFNFEGNDYVVAGDECYSDFNIINKVPTAASYNSKFSEYFIQKYANSKYKILLMHKEEDMVWKS